MATSIATRKKTKLVYKQDSDGVFRLKKVDDNKNDNISISSDELLRRRAKVDSYLNELMDCSYTVESGSSGTTSTTLQSRPRSKSASNDTDSKSGNISNDCKQTEKRQSRTPAKQEQNQCLQHQPQQHPRTPHQQARTIAWHL